MSLAPDFVIYGAVPWQEPWLVEHNLAHALARRHRVLYVEPPVTPLTPFRHASRSRREAELGHLMRRRPRRVGRLDAFRPIALPPLENRVAGRISAPAIRSQVRAAASSTGIERPVAIAALRSVLGLYGALDEQLLIYVVMDWLGAGGELLGRDSERMNAEIEAMCGAADLVCASSRQLQRTLSDRGFASEVLPHGFHSDLAELYDSAPEPSEYADLPRPLLGYSGTIDARLDFDALEALADRFRDGSLLFLGPVSPRLPRDLLEKLARRPNVHLLGLRRREELPGYLRHLDCCLMPYKNDEWARHGLPLKLWDYLYAGPPIVGSGYWSLRDFPPPLVNFSSRSQGLGETVASALSDPGGGRRQRRRFALANSWDARARHLEEMVGGLLSAASAGGAPRPRRKRLEGHGWVEPSST